MDIFAIEDVAAGIRAQAEHVIANGAPATARICLAQLALLTSDTETGRRLAAWPGKVLADAMPLRLAGGLHHLHLTGAEARLAAIYDGSITDQPTIDAMVCAIVADHDSALLPWLDGPPQTNEAGRSANFMAGLSWLSGRVGPRFELNELGASAGINSMMDRYHYNLGGICFGPDESPMRIKPDWQGPPPPNHPVEICSISGCDQAPIDLSDRDAALRVKSYVWPENHERLARMDAAILLAGQRAPDVVQADAADWVDHQLSREHGTGVTRVFLHSIVWQYIPEDRRGRIHAALHAAGATATPERPLAWMMVEINRATFCHELTVRYWDGSDGSGEAHVLAEAQAHGAWIKWYD